MNGCHDDIALSWSGSSYGFQVDYCTSGASATSNLGAVGGVEAPFYPKYQVPLNQWQHAVVVFQALLTPNNTASVAANYIL